MIGPLLFLVVLMIILTVIALSILPWYLSIPVVIVLAMLVAGFVGRELRRR